MISGILSPMHLIVILIIVLIIFGPGKLPDLGNSLGKSIKNFKKAVNGDENLDGSSDSKKINAADSASTAKKTDGSH